MMDNVSMGADGWNSLASHDGLDGVDLGIVADHTHDRSIAGYVVAPSGRANYCSIQEASSRSSLPFAVLPDRTCLRWERRSQDLRLVKCGR